MNIKAKARLNRIESQIQNLKLKRRKLLGTINWLAPKLFKRRERGTIIQARI